MLENPMKISLKVGQKHPKFKSKKNSKMSCATHEGTTIVEKKQIRCEKLGWIKSYKHNIPSWRKR